ncbi:MAG: hypothetical protein Q8L29_01610 [archaeon]|nr:hypothetical protein [archaeon]
MNKSLTNKVCSAVKSMPSKVVLSAILAMPLIGCGRQPNYSRPTSEEINQTPYKSHRNSICKIYADPEGYLKERYWADSLEESIAHFKNMKINEVISEKQIREEFPWMIYSTNPDCKIDEIDFNLADRIAIIESRRWGKDNILYKTKVNYVNGVRITERVPAYKVIKRDGAEFWQKIEGDENEK